MRGPVHEELARDHRRLEALLDLIVDAEGRADLDAYEELRRVLLRHIACEEKVLVPEARARGASVPGFERMRADHARIALLLMQRPTRAHAAELRSVLDPHDAFEEEPGGLYDTCEPSAPDAGALIARLRAVPAVKPRRLPAV